MENCAPVIVRTEIPSSERSSIGNLLHANKSAKQTSPSIFWLSLHCIHHRRSVANTVAGCVISKPQNRWTGGHSERELLDLSWSLADRKLWELQHLNSSDKRVLWIAHAFITWSATAIIFTICVLQCPKGWIYNRAALLTLRSKFWAMKAIKWRNMKPRTRVWWKYCFNGGLHECQEGKWPFAPLLWLHMNL